MLTQLLDHNSDLSRLYDEGYSIRIIQNNIVVCGIPYVTEEKKIEFASIFCSFTLIGDYEIKQVDHTVYFTGKFPCDKNGNKLISVVNSQANVILTPEIVGNYYCSSKPESGNYIDFYEKISRYTNLFLFPAKSIDPSVEVRNFEYEDYESKIFKYPDTNTARAQITSITKKLEGQKIGIIGLGGTGSYIFDFVCKTPVEKIIIVDGDILNYHNAFRMPGVVLKEDIIAKQYKVDYLVKKYSNFRNGILSYSEYIDDSNIEIIAECDFIFLSIDNPLSKNFIIEYLKSKNIPFVDAGIGISIAGDGLRGSLRVTFVDDKDSKFCDRIQQNSLDENDLYKQNIQISELNAFNAVQAILKWKKFYGFYNTVEKYSNSLFVLDEEEFYHET